MSILWVESKRTNVFHRVPARCGAFYPGPPGRRWPPPAAPFSRSLWVPQQLRFASPVPVGQTHGHPPRHQESWQSGDSGPSPPGMPPCQTSCSVLCTAWSKARPDKLLMLATEGLTEKPPPVEVAGGRRENLLAHETTLGSPRERFGIGNPAFHRPSGVPAGPFFLSSSTVARDGWRVPLGQEQKEAPPRHFSVKKTFGGPDIIGAAVRPMDLSTGI